MAVTRIVEKDLEEKGVVGQPDVPGLSALEMQQKVEQIVREVVIPAINRLMDELEAETGAGSIGMKIPEGMPASTPATVQGVAGAHIEDKANPHAVTAAQVGAYTKAETDAAIDGKVVEIGAGDMSKAVFATNGETGVVDMALNAHSAEGAGDGVKVYTHTKTGTVHNFAGSGANGRALMTADVEEGDTFALNGEAAEAWMGAEDAADTMAGQPYEGRWVTFVADEEEGTLNFKGGGGKVTVTGLSADVLLTGSTVTVKQGGRVIQQTDGAAPEKGFIAEGGTPRWGTTTYNLGALPPGDYQLILRSYAFADGNANTTYYINNVAKGSTGGVANNSSNKSSFDFTLTEESEVKVVSSGYSGGCTYVLVKLP